MSGRRGHRAVEHTADEILEAWGPTRAACLQEAALGFVALFAAPRATPAGRRHTVDVDGRDDGLALLDLLDEVLFLVETEEMVPVGTEVVDDDTVVHVVLDLAPVTPAEATGPVPKGISLSGLVLAETDDGWRARALVDV